MNNKTLKNNMAKKKGASKTTEKIEIYDTKKGVMVKLDPYSARARKLYKQLIAEGNDSQVILPDDLKYYPKSNRIYMVKSTRPKVETVSFYKKYLNELVVRNTQNYQGEKGFVLANEFIPKLEEFMLLHKGLKIVMMAFTSTYREVDSTSIEDDTRWVKAPRETITNSGEIKKAIRSSVSSIKERIADLENKFGSGWKFKKVLKLECRVAKYSPKLGGSYIEAPPVLTTKKAIVNVKNEDHQCFKWSILSSVIDIQSHPERMSHYKKLDPEDYGLDFSGITFPTPLKQIQKFEKKNNISINVYEPHYFEGKGKGKKQGKSVQRVIPRLLYKTKLLDRETKKCKMINLLRLEEGENSHYCWIKNFSRLASNNKGYNNGGKKHYCHWCLTPFASEEKLEHHKSNGCAQLSDEVKAVMPKKDNAFVEFKNHSNQIKAPFCIHADFECILKPIVSDQNNISVNECLGESSTQKYQSHEPCGFTVYGVGPEGDPLDFAPIVYRGKDAANQCIKELIKLKDVMCEKVHSNKPMIYTDESKEKFKTASCCYLCHEPFNQDLKKIIDKEDDVLIRHCLNHYTKNELIKFSSKYIDEDLEHLEKKDVIKKVAPIVKEHKDLQTMMEKHCCKKVRDHDHISGEFRGAAHNICNLVEGVKNTKKYKVPVFFHNLKGYDSHLIITKAAEHTSRINAIPQNEEKLISFEFEKMKFLDSMAFLNSGIETLAGNLYEEHRETQDGLKLSKKGFQDKKSKQVPINVQKAHKKKYGEEIWETEWREQKHTSFGKGKQKFKHSIAHCSHPEHVDLVLKKGVYPYDYFDSFARFNETELPPIDKFYNKLQNKGCSEEDYEHAREVWDAFECKTLGDYHDLYCKTDVLLQTDIFESFRETGLRDYGLDPCHYWTLPGYAWDAMLKYTGIRLELFTDIDMHLFCEQGIRGGISMISHKHATANNKYMGEKWQKHEASKYIIYWDANNLYGGAMVDLLPTGGFQWSSNYDIDSLIQCYGANAPRDKGCFVEVDLEYPDELHDLHNEYPLAVERKLVTNDMLSKTSKCLKEKLNITDDKEEKLVPNLENKTKYIADIRNIEYYIKKGLKVTKVHRVLTFDQSRWLKPFIDFNTKKRTESKNDFDSDFYKLASNAIFGKSMQNVRKQMQLDFLCTNDRWGKHQIKQDRTILNKIANPRYEHHTIYNDQLASIKSRKKEVILNKPIYVGMAVLELSKLHMYKFHYDFIKEKYGDKAKLLFTDTDSLCYVIETDDVYEDMKTNSEEFDLSNFGKNKDTVKYYDGVNKKVLLKMKDEWGGVIVEEFIGLKPKMYSMKTFKGAEKSVGKGINRSALERIPHQSFRDCLFSDDIRDQKQYFKANVIRPRKHVITTNHISKVGLSCYDNKRHILDDGVSSLAYGHYKIRDM